MMLEIFEPEREIVVVREISKIYEEFKRGTVQELVTHYQTHPVKGELVVVIKGKG